MILFLQERVTVELDNLFGDSSSPQEVSDGLCDKNDNLERAWALRESAAHGLLTIVGRIYVRAPVSSNMITTTVTVILVIPLRIPQFSVPICELLFT